MNPQTATRLETRQGAAWITLNRPENRNALSAALVNELYHHIIVLNLCAMTIEVLFFIKLSRAS